MRHKNIDAFIQYSIKADTESIDTAALQTLLDQMKDDELHQFWFHFYTRRALIKSSIAVPDWKTKEQQAYFEEETRRFRFYPKSKDANGKYIIVRKEFEEHIKVCLSKHIDEERQLRRFDKNQPLLNKIHTNIGLLVLMMVIVYPKIKTKNRRL